METKNLNLAIDGSKAVVVASLAFVGVYTSIKLVNKFCGASVVVNAKGDETGGK